MPDSKFDLGDYVEVRERIRVFYDRFGDGRLVTYRYELTSDPDDKPKVIVEAHAYRTPDDPHPGVGHSWMYLPGTTNYTRGSELENVETSSWGRAIAALGILVDKSVASANEIRAKSEDAPVKEPPDFEHGENGSLFGTVEIGKAPADFELRETPEGHVLAFRLRSGRKSIKVVAYDTLAEALGLVMSQIVGARAQCWGVVSDETFTPKGSTKSIVYQVLTLHRIQTPELTLPAPETVLGGTTEAVVADTAAASVPPDEKVRQRGAELDAQARAEDPDGPHLVGFGQALAELEDQGLLTITPSGEKASDEAPVAAQTAGAASMSGAAPVPDDLGVDQCGKPGPYSEGEVCELAKGHRGPHKSFADNATWL